MPKIFLFMVVFLYIASALAQDIYRCGWEYTTTVPKDQEKNCKLVTKQLSRAEKAQLQKCQLEATKSPTEMGVRIALAICKEKSEE